MKYFRIQLTYTDGCVEILYLPNILTIQTSFTKREVVEFKDWEKSDLFVDMHHVRKYKVLPDPVELPLEEEDDYYADHWNY